MILKVLVPLSAKLKCGNLKDNLAGYRRIIYHQSDTFPEVSPFCFYFIFVLLFLLLAYDNCNWH